MHKLPRALSQCPSTLLGGWLQAASRGLLAAVQQVQYSSSSSIRARKIGFVGLGNMGSRMAKNLVNDGHQLVVHDRSIAAMEEICKLGATSAFNPEDVASEEGVDVLITMLPSAEHVRQVYMGSDGILKAQGGVRPSLLIDSSTIDPPTARVVNAAVAQAPLHRDSQPCAGCSAAHPSLIDAPVSGGVPAASKATLTFMCGGERAAVAAAEPYLKVMGRNIVYCGQPGNGQAAKVCNNLVLGVSMAAVAEALALGVKLGLDPKLLSDIFNSSSARCWSSDTYNPCPGVMDSVPASKEYRGGFATKLMLKDLGLAEAAAQHCSASVPMSAQAAKLYQQVVDAGGSNLDFGAIYQRLYQQPEQIS